MRSLPFSASDTSSCARKLSVLVAEEEVVVVVVDSLLLLLLLLLSVVASFAAGFSDPSFSSRGFGFVLYARVVVFGDQ